MILLYLRREQGSDYLDSFPERYNENLNRLDAMLMEINGDIKDLRARLEKLEKEKTDE